MRGVDQTGKPYVLIAQRIHRITLCKTLLCTGRRELSKRSRALSTCTYPKATNDAPKPAIR